MTVNCFRKYNFSTGKIPTHMKKKKKGKIIAKCNDSLHSQFNEIKILMGVWKIEDYIHSLENKNTENSTLISGVMYVIFII